MTTPKNLRLVGAAVAAAAALALLYRTWSSDTGGPRGFFYDLSAGRLFEGPIEAIPPIPGIDGPEIDGHRAVVVSMNGRPEDRSSWQVAYLERYSPELQRQMEQSRQGGPAPAIPRSEAQAHRWVRRTNDTDWFPIASETGARIVTDWAQPGPDGLIPVVCAP